MDASPIVKRARGSSALFAETPWVITSVRLVCSSHSAVCSLSHVAHAIDSYLSLWTLEEASDAGHVKLLDHLAEQEYTGVSPYFRGKRLRNAVTSFFRRKNDRVAVLSWWMIVYDPIYDVSKIIPNVVRLAVRFNRLDVLVWLYDQGLMLNLSQPGNDLKPVSCKYPRIAYWLHEHVNGVIQTLDLLDYCSRHEYLLYVQWAHEHQDQYKINSLQGALHHAVYRGDLELLQWIYERCPDIRSTRYHFSAAIHGGHLDVAKWLYQIHSKKDDFVHPYEGSSDLQVNLWLLSEYDWTSSEHRTTWITRSIEKSAQHNHKDMVELLYCFEPKICAGKAMEHAAAGGHLEMVQFLHYYRASSSPRAMNSAAAHNHLEVVQWLHANRCEGCTTDAIDVAAANGHFEVVKWLYENRHEGCTTDAMDEAAKSGHLEIVQYLFEKRAGIISKIAKENAVLNNHLEIVKWMHANLFHLERVATAYVLERAAYKGLFDMLKWFNANGYEQFTSSVISGAASAGHLCIVRYWHNDMRNRYWCKNRCPSSALRICPSSALRICPSTELHIAAVHGHLNIVKWFYSLGERNPSLLGVAATHGHLSLVKFLTANGGVKWDEKLLEDVAHCKHFAVLEWLLKNSEDRKLTGPYLALQP